MFATLHGNPQLSITVVYAPTERSSSSVQEDLDISLNENLDQAKKHEIHLFLGILMQELACKAKCISL